MRKERKKMGKSKSGEDLRLTSRTQSGSAKANKKFLKIQTRGTWCLCNKPAKIATFPLLFHCKVDQSSPKHHHWHLFSLSLIRPGIHPGSRGSCWPSFILAHRPVCLSSLHKLTSLTSPSQRHTPSGPLSKVTC